MLNYNFLAILYLTSCSGILESKHLLLVHKHVRFIVCSKVAMSAASELFPLVSKQPTNGKKLKHCSCSVNYRLPVITEKGAIVMIVCNVLVLTAIMTQLLKISIMTTTSVAFAVMAIIIFPIVGTVADTCVGRFKVIQAGIVFLMASSLLNILLMLLQDYFPTTAETFVCYV